MLGRQIIALSLAFGVALISDSAQSQRRAGQQPIAAPSTQPAQPPAPDQRGTDQFPLSVKILPSPKSEDEAEKEQRERREKDEKAAVDKRVADDTQRLADETKNLVEETKNLAASTNWLAGFTLLLFFAAVGQIALFWRQLRLIRDSLEPAKTAADAAKLNAQSVIDAERAYLFVVIGAENIASPIRRASEISDLNMQDARLTGAKIWVEYRFRNYGRTPAIIKEVSHRLVRLPALPDIREYAPILPLPVGHIVGRDEKTDVLTCGLESALLVKDAKSIQSSESTIWLYGHIAYDDAFGWGRELRFVWHYNGDSGGFRLHSYSEVESHKPHENQR
jgi:hypothetical protein